MKRDLTGRELEVLICAAHGFSAKETADYLGISHRTVEVYAGSMRAKLHASTITHAVNLGWIYCLIKSNSFEVLSAARRLAGEAPQKRLTAGDTEPSI